MSRNIPTCKRWSVVYKRKVSPGHYSIAAATIWAPTRLLALLQAPQHLGHPLPGDRITCRRIGLPC